MPRILNIYYNTTGSAVLAFECVSVRCVFCTGGGVCCALVSAQVPPPPALDSLSLSISFITFCVWMSAVCYISHRQTHKYHNLRRVVGACIADTRYPRRRHRLRASRVWSLESGGSRISYYTSRLVVCRKEAGSDLSCATTAIVVAETCPHAKNTQRQNRCCRPYGQRRRHVVHGIGERLPGPEAGGRSARLLRGTRWQFDFAGEYLSLSLAASSIIRALPQIFALWLLGGCWCLWGDRK